MITTALCIKMMITCFVIYVAQVLLVSAVENDRQDVLPNWFYMLGVANIVVGVILFIGVILSLIWT